MAYQRPLLVRFQDVDYAQVVFYPNFFEYTHRVFEDFFADEVGCEYRRMLTERRIGFPTVHAEADFRVPLRFGDHLRVVMEVVRLSTRSITTRYRFCRADGEAALATVTVVVASVSLDTFTGVDLPDDVAAAFARHQVTSGV